VFPALRAILLQSYQDPFGGTAQDLSVIVRGDSEKYARLTSELNIKVEYLSKARHGFAATCDFRGSAATRAAAASERTQPWSRALLP